MPELLTSLTSLIALCLGYLGFALLALSQERHWLSVAPGHAAPQAIPRTVRCIACGVHAAALLMHLHAQGPAFGALLWALSLSASAVALAFTLSWRPHWLLPLSGVLKRALGGRRA